MPTKTKLFFFFFPFRKGKQLSAPFLPLRGPRPSLEAAVPFRGHTTQILGVWSPKLTQKDCSPKNHAQVRREIKVSPAAVLLQLITEKDAINPFRTAVPFWGQTTQIRIIYNLCPKRDCSPKRVDTLLLVVKRRAKLIRTQNGPKGQVSLCTFTHHIWP